MYSDPIAAATIQSGKTTNETWVCMCTHIVKIMKLEYISLIFYNLLINFPDVVQFCNL